MKNRLFIIGNGFDLAHGLPTKFDPDFKEIAEKNESISYFWDLYQSQGVDIWSDFENLLAKPDFNFLTEIFDGFSPDYSSDRESDRDGIIYQVELNGNLEQSLYDFAIQAEDALTSVEPKLEFLDQFDENDLFINFNYTHTLEQVYNIENDRVLHVHGEVDHDNLLLGYPAGEFEPENFQYDVRGKGRGPYREVDFKDYIDGIEDYYVRAAYDDLISKTKSFKKAPQLEIVAEFLHNFEIEEIVVKGHSIAIDFPYFEYFNVKFSNAKWIFYAFDDGTRWNIEDVVQRYGIKNHKTI